MPQKTNEKSPKNAWIFELYPNNIFFPSFGYFSEIRQKHLFPTAIQTKVREVLEKKSHAVHSFPISLETVYSLPFKAEEDCAHISRANTGKQILGQKLNIERAAYISYSLLHLGEAADKHMICHNCMRAKGRRFENLNTL